MMAEVKKYREIMLPWVEFARSHKAVVEVPLQEYSYNDSNFIISKENEFEIYFQWAGVPYSGPVSYDGKERNTFNDRRHLQNTTFFYFPLHPSDIKFQIHPRNLITKLMFYFNSQKRQIGDEALDKRYFFISNRSDLFNIYGLGMMKEFDSDFWDENFGVTAEGEEIGVEKRMCIRVNDLLKSTEQVERFYKLGRALQKEVNKLSLEF